MFCGVVGVSGAVCAAARTLVFSKQQVLNVSRAILLKFTNQQAITVSRSITAKLHEHFREFFLRKMLLFWWFFGTFAGETYNVSFARSVRKISEIILSEV